MCATTKYCTHMRIHWNKIITSLALLFCIEPEQEKSNKAQPNIMKNKQNKWIKKHQNDLYIPVQTILSPEKQWTEKPEWLFE